MEAEVMTALTTGLTAFGADATDVLVAVLPIGLGVAATIGVVFAGIRWLRGLISL